MESSPETAKSFFRVVSQIKWGIAIGLIGFVVIVWLFVGMIFFSDWWQGKTNTDRKTLPLIGILFHK